VTMPIRMPICISRGSVASYMRVSRNSSLAVRRPRPRTAPGWPG